MTWFRKQDPVVDEPWPALEVHPVEFAPKPPDLVQAAAHAEWTRPTLLPAPATDSLPWSKDPPTREGLYWWKPTGYHGDVAYLAPVTTFAGTLNVQIRVNGTTTWRAVSAMKREWAGPVPLGDGMRLERLGIVP